MTSDAVTVQLARAGLVRVLQDAHAGELAAAYAYRGHWRSIRRDLPVRAEIRRIEGAEWHHRSVVRGMLHELGARPRRRREVAMWVIGRFFGLLCFLPPRFGPMYAAGRLEAMNVGQYDDARRFAEQLGRTRFVAALVTMREEEVRHEVFFGDQCRGSMLLPLAVRLWGWAPPPPVPAPPEAGPAAAVAR